MKKVNIFALSVMLAACISSCEMKDELVGESVSSTETGALELAVAVQGGEESRADANPPSADEMYVEVVSTTDAEAEPAYEGLFGEMENPLTLTVGDYKVSAHTQGEIQKQMATPYYGGEADLTITKDVTSQAKVTCKIMNTKVAMNYTEEFLATFTSWTITVDNGKESVLTFTHKDQDAAIYWYLEEDEVSSLQMNFTGTTGDGATIDWQKKFTKEDAENADQYDDSEFFVGGDELDITLNIDESQPEGEIGIDIIVDLTFANTDDTVEIPIEDEEDTPTPGPGPDESLSMVMPSDGHIVYTLNGSDQPASADVLITATEGIKSMNVKIVAGNDGFGATISDLASTSLDFVTKGVEMVDNPTIGMVLGAFLGEGAEVSAPTSGATSYTFPVGAFFTLMNGFGATAPDAHVFKIVLEDKAGNKIEDELQVTINPAA